MRVESEKIASEDLIPEEHKHILRKSDHAWISTTTNHDKLDKMQVDLKVCLQK